MISGLDVAVALMASAAGAMAPFAAWYAFAFAIERDRRLTRKAGWWVLISALVGAPVGATALGSGSLLDVFVGAFTSGLGAALLGLMCFGLFRPAVTPGLPEDRPPKPDPKPEPYGDPDLEPQS